MRGFKNPFGRHRDRILQVAVFPEDFRKIWAYIARKGYQRGVEGKDKLGKPTVMMLREGKVIGFMATYSNVKYLVAGPLLADSGRIAYDLILAYEEVLRRGGATQYLFSLTKDNPWTNHKRMKLLGDYEEIGQDETLVHYRRIIPETLDFPSQERVVSSIQQMEET